MLKNKTAFADTPSSQKCLELLDNRHPVHIAPQEEHKTTTTTTTTKEKGRVEPQGPTSHQTFPKQQEGSAGGWVRGGQKGNITWA